MEKPPDPEPYLRLLPIGERLPPGSMTGSDLFPYEGELTTKPLDAPVLPEPVRSGAGGGTACGACTGPQEGVIWSGDGWRVRPLGDAPTGLPLVLILESEAHHDLEDLPLELASGLGVMMQRIARAMALVPGVGRVHVCRWGDGGEHFHVWFLARPAGMMQMRGALLPLWYDLLPRVPEDLWRTWLAVVAKALAREGGTVEEGT